MTTFVLRVVVASQVLGRTDEGEQEDSRHVCGGDREGDLEGGRPEVPVRGKEGTAASNTVS